MLGLASLVVLVVLLSWLISRSVLVPLGELNSAIQNISQGNLDFTIGYSKNDELGRLCQAFELMRRKLKESLEKQNMYENSRKAIIASISHDLRTPIAAIKAAASGLREEEVDWEPAQQAELLAAIEDGADGLAHLVDDLLAMSRIQAGALSVYPTSVSVDEVVTSVLARWQGAPVRLSIPESVPDILADPPLLERVLANLLDNAQRSVRPAEMWRSPPSAPHQPPERPRCRSVSSTTGRAQRRSAGS